MTWPLPQPDEIAERIAAGILLAFPDAPDLDPRAPDTMLGVLARTVALTLFDVHLHQRWLADQQMVDTATDWLPRHADIWAIPRIAATFATGAAQFAGVNGTSIPAGTELRAPSGAVYETLATVTIASGTAQASLRAVEAGTAGNASTDVALALVVPIAGITGQAATVVAPGLRGGAPIEGEEAWKSRVLARIRQPPMGGTAADYVAWARAASALVSQVRVYPNYVGPGTVGVVIAQAGGLAPTTPELAAIAAAIDLVRPVTAAVSVLACVPTAIAFSIELSPDTAATRLAVTAALDTFFAVEAAIGTEIPLSRVSEAISSAAGEYSHRIMSPTSAIAPTALQLPTRGTITWVTL